MATRIWFTKDNTAGLDASDLAIMNRAVRKITEPGVSPNHSTLSFIRTTYRLGMSAQELADCAVEADY